MDRSDALAGRVPVRGPLALKLCSGIRVRDECISEFCRFRCWGRCRSGLFPLVGPMNLYHLPTIRPVIDYPQRMVDRSSWQYKPVSRLPVVDRPTPPARMSSRNYRRTLTRLTAGPSPVVTHWSVSLGLEADDARKVKNVLRRRRQGRK